MAHNVALRPLQHISLSPGPAVPHQWQQFIRSALIQRAASMIRRIGYEIQFIAVLGPRSPHGMRQLPVGQHCRPDLLHPHAHDRRGCRFSLGALGAAMRSDNRQGKSDPNSTGLSRLRDRVARLSLCSPFARHSKKDRTVDLLLIEETRRKAATAAASERESSIPPPTPPVI